MLLPLLLAVWASAEPARTPAFERDAAEVARVAAQEIDETKYAMDEDADPLSFGINGVEPLPNFGVVSPGVYRSGQPNKEGLARLKALGVKTILVIRTKVGPEERAEAARLGINVESVAMSGLYSPPYPKLDQALAILKDPAKQPVLVHCRYGKDRTGATVAAYQTLINKLAVQLAVDEAKGYGCCLKTFLPLKPYLEHYLRTR